MDGTNAIIMHRQTNAAKIRFLMAFSSLFFPF